jgi:hypothetical protein
VTKRTSLSTLLVGSAVALLALLVAGVNPVAAQSEGQIGGIVYIDTNGNGIREEGEEGIQDVEVTFDSGGWSTTISTNDKGAFSLAVNPATWTISIKVPEGYTAPTTSTEVFIEAAGDAVTNLEFGLVPQSEEEEAGKEVLPASGGIVSSGVIVGGLIGMLAIGLTMVFIGQRRSKRRAP